MVLAALILGGIGLTASVVLTIASRVFHVEEDPRIKQVEDVLPGANCGGCGHAGCSAYAQAVVGGGVEVNRCVVGQSAAADAIAGLLGYETVASEPSTACSYCEGGYRADRKYEYSGVQDCRAAIQLFNGPIRCENGCLGLGTCVRVCPFGAIEMGENGLPRFLSERCVGCGTCVRNCPKGAITLNSSERTILHWNVRTECLSPCRQACPAQIDIPEFLAHVRRGEFVQAVLKIKERNPLPASTGRVCPELCAVRCRRTIQDEPLAINQLKRFAADWERCSGTRIPIPSAAYSGQHVAVVGGGPSGLSAAFYLRRLGHAVRIFEKNERLGGMLRYGIPEFRLPKDVLDWDIDGILDLGVEAETGVALGTDFTLQDLRDRGFGAVYLAVGCWQGRILPIEGKDLVGVHAAIDFLWDLQHTKGHARGQRVAVIGAGNVAMDAARSAIRDGAASVTILFIFARENMEASPREIEEAEEEGVAMRCLLRPTRVVGENGRVVGIEVQSVQLDDFEPDGQCNVVAIEGTEEIVPCDAVIFAVGQDSKLDFLHNGGACGIESTPFSTVAADDETRQSGAPDVFVGGDCFTGPGLLVQAIAAGRYAARSIHYYLKGGEIPRVEDALREMIPEALLDSLHAVEPRTPAASHELIPLADRTSTWLEIEGTISEETARNEADRCLHCGIYCYDTDMGPNATRAVTYCPNVPRDEPELVHA